MMKIDLIDFMYFFNGFLHLCNDLDAIWIFGWIVVDKWVGARHVLAATYCWNSSDAKK